MNQQQARSNHPSVREWKRGRRYVGYFYFSLLVLGTFAVSQTVRAEDAEKKEQITLQGIVVDEQDKPVADAKVVVEWLYPEKGQIETRTDRQGQFTLHAPVQNERVHFIRAERNVAHLMAQQLLSWEKLTDDPALKQLRLKLQPARRVELLVVDAAGKPIANATAGVLADNREWGTGLTDEQGRIVFRLPRDVTFQKAFAISDGHGVDYKIFSVPREMTADRLERPPVWPDHPVQLKLEGARSLKVLLTETDGTPIPGVRVYPWYIQKPNNPDLYLSSINNLVAETTDAHGAVVFQWIPHWHQKQLTIWPSDQQHAKQRGVYDPKTGDGTLTIQLEKLVPISGRITLPDGSSARGIEITVSGENYRSDDFRKSVFTDEEGRYTIQAAPNMIYLVTAGNREWASAPQTGFALWPGKPIENLDSQLRPATRIHGRITVGPQNEPLADHSFNLYQFGQDLKNTHGVTLPNPKYSRKMVRPLIAHLVSTDEMGNFEVSVGDGQFVVRGLSWIVSQNADTVTEFVINGEPEKELNFHALRPQEGALTGTVVTGDPPQPVADAKVIGVYARSTTVGKLVSTTDKFGKFRVNRELYRTVIYAHSKDKKRAGVVEIGPDTKTVTIPLRPSGTVAGQLIDAKTKQPLKEVEIRYGVMLRLDKNDDSRQSIDFSDNTTTDQTGHFKIDDLVLGQKYRLTVVFHPEPGTSSSRILETVRVEDDEALDLGTLEMEPPRTQGRLTLEDQITAAFKEPGTPGERFIRQKQEARIAMQHNLVLFGDPRGETVRQLMQLRYRDGKVRRKLYSFLMMSVDTSADNRPAAQQLAKTLGEKLAGDHADFLLVITDEQSKPLAHADRSALSKNGKITREQVLTFLQTHTVPIRNAEELLAAALKQAKEQNKRVIVQETATWCGPCRLLSQFLDREREQWQRDYIWIKMDHRWTGADEIMKTMRGGAQGGIPWWAILDKDGKVLITSNDEEGENIGFPSSSTGREHFRGMLEKTAIRLTPMDVNTLVEALKQKD